MSRQGFIARPVPDETLQRLLAAAHSAPSVGLLQPSRFIVIRDFATRKAVHTIFHEANARAAATYAEKRAEQYAALKLEGILESPQNLCIVCDTQNERGHKLGRHTIPETAVYSTVCAIQNLWLAARAEGIGVGLGKHLRSGSPPRFTPHSRTRSVGCVFVSRLCRPLRSRARARTGRLGEARAVTVGHLLRPLQRRRCVMKARAIMVLGTSSHVGNLC